MDNTKTDLITKWPSQGSTTSDPDDDGLLLEPTWTLGSQGGGGAPASDFTDQFAKLPWLQQTDGILDLGGNLLG